MTDPLASIEDAQAQRDLGTFAYRFYQGARDDGATPLSAFTVTVALLLAMFKKNDEAL